MKPFSSILTIGALLAFAGRVVAAPVPDNAPGQARRTKIVWHTIYHTNYVAVTKTEWVDPPTTTTTIKKKTTTTIDEETTTTTTTTTPPTTTSTTTSTTESTTEEEYPTTSTTSTTTTPSSTTTTTTTSSTTTEEEISTTDTPTPTPPKPDVKVELPTTTPTPEPTPEPESQTSTDGGWEGDATYYDPGMGSCGYTNGSGDMIAAISYLVLDPLNPGNPNKNPLCGKKIRCTRNGKYPTIITVVDRCPICAKGDLDLSPAAYAALGGTIAEGRFKIQCSWVDYA